ncbi:hypothetical protein C4585_00400 [Candidatus Parcubacteria bacterium]|nr:MAG: hypothetical protein C4585_00400 [Candidatus Parcubacteria bacterium]
MRDAITQRVLSLFSTPQEKGSAEWDIFLAVRDDHSGAYFVAQPKRPLIVRGPRHLLRIIVPRPRRLRSAH